MFEEIFRIIFDRRHIKDVRLWVLIVLVIGTAGSLWTYDRYMARPVRERQDRQARLIHKIIKAGKLREKIDALPNDEPSPKGEMP